MLRRRVLLLEDDLALRSLLHEALEDRKSTRLNSSHRCISYAVFCLKKKKNTKRRLYGITVTQLRATPIGQALHHHPLSIIVQLLSASLILHHKTRQAPPLTPPPQIT